MRNSFRTITEELYSLHQVLMDEWPHLLRIAVALYDEQTGMLHTFTHSNQRASLLNHYSIELNKVPSLQELAEHGKPRVIQDLSVLMACQTVHSQSITEHFKSSYTEPFYLNNTLLGFVFYDASDVNYFNEHLTKQLSAYTRLIESLVVSEVLPVKSLIGLVETAKELTSLRDSETGKHLIRMASYMEIIVIELAEQFGFTDEQIEFMWLYAPLHDIGKMAIPDEILIKPGILEPDEYRIMQTHVQEGLKFLEIIQKNFNFQPLHHSEMLRDIIGAHHERWNGSGYPLGLKAEAIPVVGRIAAVADVFDALSSDRVYRKSWPVKKVFDYIVENSGVLFDSDCVEALLKNKDRVIKVMNTYKEDVESLAS